ncbi:DMT family transporter [Companilactobacillus hulinensis]|uniref:DMT family transporter n=1 Tax=Companilactobacillus hulinensis TaxID=2486007 RepID=UPI000F794796|nr:DMT family transporter [Companilactobacillus hulinensis]
MIILALVPVLMGCGIAMQTAINSKLRHFVKSPYLASTVSFTIGALFLIALTIMSGESPFVSTNIIIGNPWWIWLGGLLGVIGLTANILLFPHLGSIQTAVLPLFGQIIMGIIIDQFGLFSSPKSGLTIIKVLGVLLVTVGMLLATGMIGSKDRRGTGKNNLLLQLAGIGAGLLMASQVAINGHLGVILKSSVHAAMVSFSIGAILLWILLFILRTPIHDLSSAIHAGKSYWWIWIGGFLGAAYVFGSAWLVPQIGTGQVVVIALFGQLLFSALIDHLGLLGSPVNRVNFTRVIGLIIMFVGVAGIHFL